MAQPALNALTFEQIAALEERENQRYEYWDGDLLPMTGGTSAHNQIALGLYRVLQPQVAPCLTYVADMALKLNPGEYSDKAYPDVMVVCQPLAGHFQNEPILVAEVLSDSSVARDRGDKWRAYTALESLEVYLILSQTALHIEAYTRADDWRSYDYIGKDSVIELAQPALKIPLAEVYQTVLNQFYPD